MTFFTADDFLSDMCPLTREEREFIADRANEKLNTIDPKGYWMWYTKVLSKEKPPTEDEHR